MKKRICSILLSILLVLTMMPAYAFAGSTDDEVPLLLYTTWQNAAVVSEGKTVHFALDQYHSDFTEDQVWLAVNVDSDDLAIQMEFEHLNSEMNVRLYDAVTLADEGPDYDNSLWNWELSSSGEVSYKVPHAGVYYVMLRAYGSYLFSKPAALTVRQVDGDTNENNDTRENATPLTVNVDTIYNLNGENDEDWFAIRTLKKGQAVKVVLSGFNYEVNPVNAFLYREGEEYSVLDRYALRKDTELYWKAEKKEETCYLRLAPYNLSVLQNLKVRFELVDGDANENNDDWTEATELTENNDSYYTLTGGNDVDWFRIMTLDPGAAIRVVLGNFDYTCQPVKAELFSKTQLEGDESVELYPLNQVETAQNNDFYWKVNEPGEYYLRLQMEDDKQVNLKDLTVRYDLIPGDSYELNENENTAAPIPQDGYEMEFNLNGPNDIDCFYFETELPNDVVTIDFRGFETDYSNPIHYEVYDFNEADGSRNVWDYRDSISVVHQSTFICPEPGKHYIRITSRYDCSFENLLKMKIEHRPVSDGEPNDTWQTATPASIDVANIFNLPNQSDVDWFKYTVTESQQTLALRMTMPADAGMSMYAEVYNGKELDAHGDNADWIMEPVYGDSFSGLRETYCMLSEPGDYYVKVYGYGSGFESDATLTCSLVSPDQWEGEENNNTWKKASTIPEGVDNIFTLPAYNDQDYYKITTEEPNQTVEFTLNLPVDSDICSFLYSGADFWREGDNASPMRANNYYENQATAGVNIVRYQLEEPGDYYLYLSPAYRYSSSGSPYGLVHEKATLSYRYIEPDRNEGNNTWQTATTLNEGVASIFTMPAPNDMDWFKFTTTQDYQTVKVDVTLPAGGSLQVADIYSAEELNTHGDGAASQGSIGWRAGYNRLMLGKAGEYYLCFKPEYSYSSGPTRVSGLFDQDATLTFHLIGPDANEYNDDWQNATPLSPQADTSYTLPAMNDYDWFYLGQIEAGDRFSLYFNGLLEGYESDVWYAVYSKYEYDADVSQEGGWYGAGYPTDRDSNTFTAQETGDYYVCVTRSEPSFWSDPVMSIRYSVIRDATPIEALGVSSIGNAPTTIYQGKTLGLYPVFTPANASDQTVTWSSDNTSVASVDENGLVTAVSPGTAHITCTSVSNTAIRATSTITVAAPVPVKGVKVTSNEIHKEGEAKDNPKLLSLGTAIQLEYHTDPAGATEQDVSWSVSDPKVLKVTNYGKVSAIGSGTAYVTVTTADGGYKANYYVYVPDQTYKVTRVTLNSAAETIYMEEEGPQLTATVHPTYATNQEVKWASDNENVLKVDQNGKLTPVSVGYANVTVSAQENPSLKAKCAVSVQPKRTRVTGVSFEKETMELGLYGTTRLEPVVAPDNATDKSVTWSTSNKNIVLVSRQGVITGLNIGTAVITAMTADGEKTANLTVKVSSSAPLGDVNNDGEVDAADALLILRSSVRLIALSTAQQSVADVNHDGEIDAGDAVLILRYDAGLLKEFPKKKN